MKKLSDATGITVSLRRTEQRPPRTVIAEPPFNENWNDRFDIPFADAPHGFWVMLTYVVGQVLGWLQGFLVNDIVLEAAFVAGRAVCLVALFIVQWGVVQLAIPLFAGLFNAHLEEGARATSLSLINGVVTIYIGIGGVVLGWLAGRNLSLMFAILGVVILAGTILVRPAPAEDAIDRSGSVGMTEPGAGALASTVFAHIVNDTSNLVDVIFTGHTHKQYAWDAPVPGETARTRPILQTGRPLGIVSLEPLIARLSTDAVLLGDPRAGARRRPLADHHL